MLVLAIDLGGTKLAFAVFDENGEVHFNDRVLIKGSSGEGVGRLMTDHILQIFARFREEQKTISAIGISVPGLVRHEKGTVWAPNIDGWEDYPLLTEVQSIASDLQVVIESDRTCYILGERWKGNAEGCDNAVFLAVGTGIGAGIITNGTVVKGANDIGGSVGWMVHTAPVGEPDGKNECAFETYASGNGIAKLAKELISSSPDYNGILKNSEEQLTAHDVFAAYEKDEMAQKTLQECIKLWGKAVANFVSIFNPEKVILGGGVFGPAVRFIPDIKQEAKKWAQPVSEKLYSLEASKLGKDAGLYGAAFAALQHLNKHSKTESV